MCAVHRDGLGTGWGDVENLDADQPHGKDYLQLNHIAKGVRKRVNKEHEAFGDTTAGGEHLAGGCRILGITDATADITAGAGDASYDITVGKFIGRGLIYDQTTNSLWCYTGDGTVTDDPYEMKWAARSICMGDDFVWTGGQQFNAGIVTTLMYVELSCDVSDFGVKGDASIAGALNVVGDVSVGGSVLIATDLTISGDMAIDGTSNFYDEIDASDVAFDGTFTFNAGAVFNHFGDLSGRTKNTTYQAATDGMLYVTATGFDQRPYYRVLSDSGAAPTKVLARVRDTDGDTAHNNSFLIKKGNYYCVCDIGTFGDITLNWLPFGDNT